jgi:hypothetical protein
MSDIIASKSLAILHISLNWERDFAGRVATFYVPINVWRDPDLLHPSLAQALKRRNIPCWNATRILNSGNI